VESGPEYISNTLDEGPSWGKTHELDEPCTVAKVMRVRPCGYFS